MDDDEDRSDELADIEHKRLFDAAGWTLEDERDHTRDIAKPEISKRDGIARSCFDRLVGWGLYAPNAEEEARMAEEFFALTREEWEIHHGDLSPRALPANQHQFITLEVTPSEMFLLIQRIDAMARRGIASGDDAMMQGYADFLLQRIETWREAAR